jgi:protein TonB
LTIKKFILLSVIIHIAFFLTLYVMPPAKKKEERKPLITSLVSPDELMRRQEKPPAAKKIRPLPPRPVPPAPRRKIPVLPERQPYAQRRPVPLPRIPVPLPPPREPMENKPVGPGESDRGKPLPPGVVPRPGKGEGEKEGVASGKGKSEKGSKASRGPGYLSNKQLFDRDVIGKVAREDRGGSSGKVKKDDALTFDTTEYSYMPYMRKLREKIESIWVYPPDAAAKNIWGDLKIRFTIKKDGTLGAVELVRTSGYHSLDEAALKALRDGAPYWPLPDSWRKDSYTILGHFIYSMYGYQQIR